MKRLKCFEKQYFDKNTTCIGCGSVCRPDVILFDEDLEKKKVHEIYKRCKM